MVDVIIAMPGVDVLCPLFFDLCSFYGQSADYRPSTTRRAAVDAIQSASDNHSKLKTTDTQKLHPTGTRLSSFARRLLAAWRGQELPTSDDTVILAASGGADSTSLVLGFDELLRTKKLSLSLTVAHLDHGLRKVSRDEAAWVVALAKKLGYKSAKRRVDVQKRATETGDNLEQAARRARYEFLKSVAKKENAQFILTAHTLDDQAETILLRLLRGSAAEGLGGIEVMRSVEAGSRVQLVRPLVSWARRSDAEDYCRARQVEFRHDEMNQDEKFARVRVRKQLLPLMQSFNNKIVETLSRTATLLREDAGALSAEASKLLALASKPSGNNSSKTEGASLNVNVMANAPAAVRRRALRLWLTRERGHLRRLEMVHLLAIDRLLTENRGGRIAQLPDGGHVTRKRGRLELIGVANGKKG